MEESPSVTNLRATCCHEHHGTGPIPRESVGELLTDEHGGTYIDDQVIVNVLCIPAAKRCTDRVRVVQHQAIDVERGSRLRFVQKRVSRLWLA